MGTGRHGARRGVIAVNMLSVIGWPVLDRIQLGPLALSPHGIGIAAGYLAGVWWMLREGPKRGVREDHVGTIVVWALVGAILGARLFYVLGHLEEFTRPTLGETLLEIVAVWRGGITLVGGILGAILLAYPFMRRYGYRFGQVMDSAAIGLAFGIAVGRIGDLIIGDHLGKPTDFALGFRYVSGTLPGPWQPTSEDQWVARLAEGQTQVIGPERTTLFGPNQELLRQGAGVHQTALYDLLIAAGLFAFLWWLSRRPRREATLIAVFAVWYGAGRIVTDFLRVDKTWVIGLTGSQWASVGAVLLGLGVLVWFALRPGPPPPRIRGPLAAGALRPTTEFSPPPEPAAPPPGG